MTDVIGESGELQPAAPILPSQATVDSLLAAAGFGAGGSHAHQAEGRDGIDAFLYGETIDAAILACRGTVPVRFVLEPAMGASRILGDWLHNARPALVQGAPYGLSGHIHAGHACSLDNLWTSPKGLGRLLARIADAAAKGRRRLVTGHSKGGALAMLAALRLAEIGDPDLLPAAVCPFGAPRTGNGVFARAFERRFSGRSWRFEYQDDVVPHVPPAGGSWFAARKAYDPFRRGDTEINRDHLPMRGHGYMDVLAARSG